MRHEIVVGLDDSPSSKLALQWAAQQAKSTDAVLRAVHVSSTELEDSYRQAITGCLRRCPRVRIGSCVGGRPQRPAKSTTQVSEAL